MIQIIIMDSGIAIKTKMRKLGSRLVSDGGGVDSKMLVFGCWGGKIYFYYTIV